MRLDYFDSVRSELAAFHSQIEGNPVIKAIDEKELGVTIANWYETQQAFEAVSYLRST